MSEVHRSLRVRYFKIHEGWCLKNNNLKNVIIFQKNQLANMNLRKISEMGIEISKEQ